MPRMHANEPIDTRLALQVYAALALVGGFVLSAWGQVWLGSDLAELQWGKAALVRMSGAIVMAAGFCALGLAGGDVPTRRRGLSWFLAAHGVIWLALVTQVAGPWGRAPFASQVSWGLLALILGLVYVRIPSAPGARSPLSVVNPAPPPGAADAARSRDEQRIRETAAQEERNRLARDLHDAIKQQIFAIQTGAATAEARFAPDPAGAREALAQIRQSAREAMAEMEAMLDHLRAVPLENVGLVEAIKKQGEALAFRTGADVQVHVGRLPPSDALEPGAHQAVFRITQEALANIGRHARAQHVSVSLDASYGRLEVIVEDDGVGVESHGSTRGMGIQNMRARAAELDGRLEIGTRAGGGTAVRLSVPYETSEELRARRKYALNMGVAFGLISVLTFKRLLTDGFVLGTAFLLLFILFAANNLLTYWRLRRGRRQPAPAEGAP